MSNGSVWHNDELQLLEKLWNDNHSASAIAGKMPGRSRNAILGRVHRLGLQMRANKHNTAVYRTNSVGPRKPRPARPPREPVIKRELAAKYSEGKSISHDAVWQPIEGVLPVTIIDRRRNQCAWPLDIPHETGQWPVCGAPVHPERSYCASHCLVAYYPPKKRTGHFRQWGKY